MSMYVRSNPNSVFARSRLGKVSESLSNVYERLSSGKRIIRASDDAVGLAVSTQFEHDASSQKIARRNAREGISLVQTAEGGVEQLVTMLNRMREVATRMATATSTDEDRSNASLELRSIQEEMERIAGGTSFNSIPLLGVSLQLTFQVGLDDIADHRITLSIASTLRTSSLGLDVLNFNSAADAVNVLAVVSAAIETVTGYRSKLGALQNRLELAIENLTYEIESATQASTHIINADMAEETATLSRLQILMKSGTAVLCQANTSPQAALSLIGGR